MSCNFRDSVICKLLPGLLSVTCKTDKKPVWPKFKWLVSNPRRTESFRWRRQRRGVGLGPEELIRLHSQKSARLGKKCVHFPNSRFRRRERRTRFPPNGLSKVRRALRGGSRGRGGTEMWGFWPGCLFLESMEQKNHHPAKWPTFHASGSNETDSRSAGKASRSQN